MTSRQELPSGAATGGLTSASGSDGSSPGPALELVIKALYQEHASTLREYACGVVTSRDLAEAIVQDAFVSLANRMVAGATIAQPAKYLWRTVRNKALNALRDLRVRERAMQRLSALAPPEEQSPDDSPLAQVIYADRAAALWGAVHELREEQRLVVVLASNYGCSVAELGFVLGLSVTGISRIYARAMRTLRARLQAATFA